MQINKINIQAISKGFKSLFDSAFGKAEPQWQRIAMKVPSNSKSNVYGWLGQLPGIREWIGDRVLNNLKTHDFEIKNKSWEDTIVVDADDVKDDNIGIYNPMVTMLGDEVANHPDNLIFGLLASSFITPCYDGQYLIDTDHPALDASGTEISVSNHGGGASAAWFLIDDSKSVKPFIYQEREAFKFVSKDNPDDDNVFMRKQFIYGVDGRNNAGVALWQLIFGSKKTLDATNVKAGITSMKSLKKDNSKTPLRIKPKLLVVGPSNEDAADELMKAKEINGTTNTLRGKLEVMVVDWLE